MRPGRPGQAVALLDEIRNGVEPESIDAHLLEPERRDSLCFLACGGMLVVQVGHPMPENSVVVLVANGRLVPHLLSPRSLDVGLRRRPAKPAAVRRCRIELRVLEEWVLV